MPIKPRSLNEGCACFSSCWVSRQGPWLPEFLAEWVSLQNGFHSFVPCRGRKVPCLCVENAKQECLVSSLWFVTILQWELQSDYQHSTLSAPDMLRCRFVCGGLWLLIMWKKGKACQSTSLLWVWLMASAVNQNLASNHIQTGLWLLVMQWCQSPCPSPGSLQLADALPGGRCQEKEFGLVFLMHQICFWTIGILFYQQFSGLLISQLS